MKMNDREKTKDAAHAERHARRGVFYISRRMLDERSHLIPRILCMLEFTPYRVEFQLSVSALECIGTSPLFDFLSEGEQAPGYEIEIDTDSEGIPQSVRAVRA